jgi:hypothetical protein
LCQGLRWGVAPEAEGSARAACLRAPWGAVLRAGRVQVCHATHARIDLRFSLAGQELLLKLVEDHYPLPRHPDEPTDAEPARMGGRSRKGAARVSFCAPHGLDPSPHRWGGGGPEPSISFWDSRALQRIFVLLGVQLRQFCSDFCSAGCAAPPILF